MQVLLGPVVSEKSTMIGEKHDQVAFRVMHDATKTEIKAAIELLFKVQVDRVSDSESKGQAEALWPFRGPARQRAQGVCPAEAGPGNRLCAGNR